MVPAAVLPVFDAISRLCRQPDGEARRRTSGPACADVARFAAAPPRSNRDGSTPIDQNRRDHLSIEIIQALEAIARVKPLVLVLEDLHWSDNSTVELIAQLHAAQSLRGLLLIGTYRPAERAEEQPYFLRVCQELQAHFQLEDLALHLLSVGEVQEYLKSAYGQWKDVETARRSSCIPEPKEPPLPRPPHQASGWQRQPSVGRERMVPGARLALGANRPADASGSD
jgi:hypothetical protein